MPFTLSLMPATHFKQVGTGATKGWESCGMLQKTPVWKGPQVNKLTGSFTFYTASQVFGIYC